MKDLWFMGQHRSRLLPFPHWWMEITCRDKWTLTTRCGNSTTKNKPVRFVWTIIWICRPVAGTSTTAIVCWCGTREIGPVRSAENSTGKWWGSYASGAGRCTEKWSWGKSEKERTSPARGVWKRPGIGYTSIYDLGRLDWSFYHIIGFCCSGYIIGFMVGEDADRQNFRCIVREKGL